MSEQRMPKYVWMDGKVIPFDEILLCGSGTEIAPVASVDRILLGNGSAGPVTRDLFKRFFDIARGNNSRYDKWLTPTYRK